MMTKKFNSSRITLLVIALISVSIIFVVFPKIDLLVSHLVYEKEHNFLLRDSDLHVFVDIWIRPSIKYLVIAFIFVCVFKLFWGKSAIKRRV